MQANQTPSPIPLPFAANGAKNIIPETSQISITPGAASLNDGFPPSTMISPLSGGTPPLGKDMNGILNLLSKTARWSQAGGSFTYNAAFATDPNVSGYPQGAVLLQASGAGFWFNTVDNNQSDPDAGGAGWLSLSPDWNATSGPTEILNKPTFAEVATSGSYVDLVNKPNLEEVATSGNYDDLDNKPNLATVATTGSYGDLLNLPTGFPSNLPGFIIELGHGAQANGGRGIDQGSYYQLDMTIGSNAFNGLAVTFNSDKTMTLPVGTYLIVGSAVIGNGGATDTYQVPIQMVLSAGYTGYGFPGIYQYSTRVFPGPVTGTLSLSGGFGSIGLSGTGPGVSPMAVMFSKIAGSVSGTTLALQGYVTFLKIG